jgi:uncharacterized NAD-dependent epimerase/dehydratase family protein
MVDPIKRILGESGPEDIVREFYKFLVSKKLSDEDVEDLLVHDLVQYAAADDMELKDFLSTSSLRDEPIVNQMFQLLKANSESVINTEEPGDENETFDNMKSLVEQGFILMSWGEMGYYEVIAIKPQFRKFAEKAGYGVTNIKDVMVEMFY